MLFLAGLGLCTLALLWPGLSDNEVPAFRDGYHFYYPQAVWLDRSAAAREFFPRWNRYDGLGTSVAGQVSSALYYPLRILWLIPATSIEQRYSIFIWTHVLIAALGMAYAAHRIAVRGAAASLAMISFAFSCPIFFQLNNLIYLCSAAWIGFALGGMIDLFRQPPRNWQGIAAFTLATSMMLLAGDPQTAVHSIIIAFFGCIWMLASSRDWRSSLRAGGKLLVGLALIAVLTAVQWIPAWHWSQLSNRTAIEGDAQELQAAVAPLSEEHAGLVRTLAGFELEAQRRYEFSLSPWTAATLVWPIFGGHYQPTNSRWFTAIGSEGRMWIPSLYIGTVPVLLCIWGLFHAAKPRWLLWLALFSFAAALGNYSPIWLLREALRGIGWDQLADSLPPDQSLSVYGALVALVPGYGSFRFPAKWTVWFAAGGSLFAAASLHMFLHRGGDSLREVISRRTFSVLIAGSALIAAVAGLIQVNPLHALAVARLPADAWLGTATPSAIAYDLWFSTFVVALVVFLVRFFPRWTASGLVLLVLLELAVVNRNWCQFVDPRAFDLPASGPKTNLTSMDGAFVWIDATAAHINKHTNLQSKLLFRQTELQNRFLVGKLAVVADLRNLAASQSIEPAIVEKLRLWLSSVDNLQSEQPLLDTWLAGLGVTHRLASDAGDGGQPLVWQSIQGARPLCELVVESDDQEASTAQVAWTWRTQDQLVIEIDAAFDDPNSNASSAAAVAGGVRRPVARKLLVRQLNDGGWLCWAESGGELRPLSVNQAPTPFLELGLPEGVTKVRLQRKRLR
jgi:hypothetical protein